VAELLAQFVFEVVQCRRLEKLRLDLENLSIDAHQKVRATLKRALLETSDLEAGLDEIRPHAKLPRCSGDLIPLAQTLDERLLWIGSRSVQVEAETQ
jgi:hypothetical protein